MKRCKNWVVTIVALLMLVGEISILPANLQGSTSVVNAAVHHRRRKHQYRDKTKIYTSNYRIVGNKRSKIFHVMRGHNNRLNLPTCDEKQIDYYHKFYKLKDF